MLMTQIHYRENADLHGSFKLIFVIRLLWKKLFFLGANPTPEPESANWRSNSFQSFMLNPSIKGFSLLLELGQSFS